MIFETSGCRTTSEWSNSTIFISSIPFDFQVNKSLFEKNEIPSKLKLNIKEITQMFSSSQIEEGGFFIMIGKKK